MRSTEWRRGIPKVGSGPGLGLDARSGAAPLGTAFQRVLCRLSYGGNIGPTADYSGHAVGEVRQPGAYTVSSLSTVINALFVSGGPTKTVRCGVSS